MGRLKTILTFVFAMLITVSTMTTSVIAADEEIAYILFEKNTQTVIGYEGELPDKLVIPSSIDGIAVENVIESAFDSSMTVHSIIFPPEANAIYKEEYTAPSNPDIFKYAVDIRISGDSYGAYKFDMYSQTILGYNSDEKDVVIPSTIEGVQVKVIGRDAFKYENITSVTIPEGVVEIQSDAFYGNLLTSVTLPSTLETFGDAAFFDNQLTSITIPEKITILPDNCFANNKITEIIFNKNIKTIDRFAFDRNELTSVTLPEGLETIGYSCFSENKIKTFNIPSTVKTIDCWAFSYNDIENIIIPSNVTAIGDGAFYNNPNIKHVEVLETLTEILQNDGSAPEPVTYWNLTDEYLFSGFYDVKVYKGEKYGDYYFDKESGAFTGLSYTGGYDLVIPEQIDGVDVIAIGDSAFSGRGLESVVIPHTVETIGSNAFFDNRLEELILPVNLKIIGENAFNENYLEEIIIPEDVKSIGWGAFRYNQLNSVVLPSKLAKIGEVAFEKNQLVKVEVPNTITTIDMGYYYSGEVVEVNPDNLLEKLIQYNVFDDITEITVYEDFKYGDFYVNLDTGTITSYNPTGSKVVEVPSEVNGVVITKIDDSAFEALGIESVVFSETITEIGENAFSGNKLSEVKFPDSVITIGRGAFSNNKITTVELPKNITEISDNSFANNSIVSITIPNGVTYIGRGAFENNKISKLVIPESVLEIGTRAFYSNNLKSVTIPESLVSIVGYVGDNSDNSFKKETYEMDKDQLIYLKVFDESVDIKFNNNNSAIFIGIGVGVAVAVIFIVVVVIVLKRKRKVENLEYSEHTVNTVEEFITTDEIDVNSLVEAVDVNSGEVMDNKDPEDPENK